jgi:hypothetical protein
MKNKIVFLSVLFILALTNSEIIAQRVYIKVTTSNPTIAKTNVYIYENGVVQEKEIENNFSKPAESLKSFATILEVYFNQGYKIISNASAFGGSNFYYCEYILDKS